MAKLSAEGGPGGAAEDVLLQAAEWFALLRSGQATEDDMCRWRQWLGVQGCPQWLAWQQVEAIGGRFEQVSEAPARRILHRADRQRRRVLFSLAGMGAVAGGAFLWSHPRNAWQEWGADYRAGTGEIQEFSLEDGTRLWLNTDSVADVRFDATQRLVQLLRGEIFVQTAQDDHRARPFIVQTAHGMIQPLGTRFGVWTRPDSLMLSVYEGAVELADEGLVERISAGQQLAYVSRSAGPLLPVDPARESWINGLLPVAGMRLGDVLQELSRYRPGYLRCAPEVADIRLVGVYSLRDTDHALDSIARTLPVRVVRRTRWWVSVEAA